MALLREPLSPDHPLSGMGAGQTLENGVECFLCFGALGGPDDEGYPIIFWQSGATIVYWHAACAADFCFRLGQDVQMLKHEDSLRIGLISNKTIPR